MAVISLYIDEDAMDSDLVVALRARGVTVATAIDTGLTGKTDEEQLEFASSQGSVLYTFNVCDFYRIHNDWVGSGRQHAGIVMAAQQRYSIGSQLNRILRLRAAKTAAAMLNRVEFLSRWG